MIEPDTKVDLVVDPGRYLARALNAWSTHSGFGELQNQAYGYLFPMGPVFWFGDLLGMPAWATQRVWWDILLLTAGIGAHRVGREVVALGRGSALLAAGLYALSPRVLTLLPTLSVEAWPGAVMPWLIRAGWRYRTGQISRARLAVETAALTTCLGGVNATASLCALLGAFIFLVVTLPGAVRPAPAALLAWCLGALAGAAWWLGPLIVLGQYAYPFMDFIETSRITTAVTSVPGVLRGASDWVAYILDAENHPVWQSGWIMAQSRTAIVAGCLVAATGLWGVARGIRTENRRVWVALGVMLVVGVVGMSAGHGGTFGGGLSEFVRQLLDGPAAAARNVHKLDPLVRLPLAFGVALAASVACRNQARSRVRALARAGVALAVAASLTTLWVGRAGAANPVAAYPHSLQQTAEAVDADAASRGGVTLVLPSARTASYVWGENTDEPLTAFAASPVAVRASAPLVHPGAQRLMDALDNAVMRGGDLAPAAEAMRRAGISRVVIRHGLTAATQTANPQRYVEHLAHARDFSDHRTFGSGDRRFDVFSVSGPRAVTPELRQQVGPRVAVLGGPESTLTLADVGVRPDAQFQMGARGGWVTDDVRMAAYHNGRPVPLAMGPTLTRADAARLRIGALPLRFPGFESSASARTLTGVDAVDATDSAGDPFSDLYLGPGAGAYAAIDGSSATAWLTRATNPGQLRLMWHRGVSASHTVRVDLAGSLRSPGLSVVARSTNGTVRPAVHLTARQATFEVPRGTRQLILTPAAAPDATPGTTVGIANISMAGLPLDAPVTLPAPVDPQSNGVVVTKAQPMAQGRALASDDAGPAWYRQLSVTRPGSMNVKVKVKAGASCAGVRVTATAVSRDGRQGASTTAKMSGDCAGTLQLPAGVVNLKVDGEAAERVALLPSGRQALAALGLSGASDQAVIASTTQGENAGWRTTDQTGARPVVVDGWRQAALSKQPVAWIFAPGTAHRLALAVGAALSLLSCLAAMAPWGRRKSDVDAAPEAAHRVTGLGGRWALGAGLFLLTSVGFLLAGWPGAALGLLIGGVRPRIRWFEMAMWAAMAMSGLVLAFFGAVATTAIGAQVGQLLGTFAVLALIGALLDGSNESADARSGSTMRSRASTQ